MVRILAMVAAFSVGIMCAGCHAAQHVTAQSSQVTDNFKLQFIRSCSPIGGNPQAVTYMLPRSLELLDAAPQLSSPMPTQACGNDTLTIIGSRITATQTADTTVTKSAVSRPDASWSAPYVSSTRPLLLLFILSFCLNLLFVYILSKLGGRK